MTLLFQPDRSVSLMFAIWATFGDCTSIKLDAFLWRKYQLLPTFMLLGQTDSTRRDTRKEKRKRLNASYFYRLKLCCGLMREICFLVSDSSLERRYLIEVLCPKYYRITMPGPALSCCTAYESFFLVRPETELHPYDAAAWLVVVNGLTIHSGSSEQILVGLNNISFVI
jgi:hypothetical protein